MTCSMPSRAAEAELCTMDIRDTCQAAAAASVHRNAGWRVSRARLPTQVGDERWTSVFNPQTRRFEEQLKMHYRQVAFDVVRFDVSLHQLKDRSSVGRPLGQATHQRKLVCSCTSF